MAEMKRSSLVDDSFDSAAPGKKAKKSSSGSSGNTIKLVLVFVCLGIAAVLLAFQFNLLPNPFEEKIKPVVRSAEDDKAAAESQRINEATKKAPNTPVGGS